MSVSEIVDSITNAAPEAPSAEGVAAAAESSLKTEPDHSKSFSLLAKRERELVERERRLKELEEDSGKYRSLKEKKNPKAIMDEYGLDFKSVAESVLSDGEETIESKLKALEEKLSAKEKAEMEREEKAKNAQYEEQLNTFKKNIKDTIENTKEKNELAHLFGAHETVFQVIEAYHAKTGEIMPLEKAIEHVETYLEREAEKVLQSKKMQSKWELSKGIEQKSEAVGQSKTLTNLATPTSQTAEKRSLSKEESLKEAAKLLKWQ